MAPKKLYRTTLIFSRGAILEVGKPTEIIVNVWDAGPLWAAVTPLSLSELDTENIFQNIVVIILILLSKDVKERFELCRP